MNYDICVLGLGYIGLPTASIFATKGKQVLGVDVVQRVVDTINQGRIHIEEPDLDILVKAAVQSGNLVAATEPASARTYIIAVPTPFEKGHNGEKIPDLNFVQKATESIASVVKDGALIILESTSPVGTTEKVKGWLEAALKRTNRKVNPKKLLYAHCPERILPGQMLKELVSNDRIAGGLTPEASEAAKELYRVFCTAEIFVTNARTAEMAKLTENASRDVSIAFANELSLICDQLDIDVWELIELANRHPRVNILQPGPGVGGHCIAVDPWFIVDAAGDKARLIRTAREVNDSKPQHVISQVRAKAERFKKPVIACLGLAFKANVDDLRESPACDIARELAKEKDHKVLIVEPYIRELPKGLKGKAQLKDLDDALKMADIVVLLVDHRQFKSIPKTRLRGKVLIDTKGVFR
ncbi:UDP-N-acetyl-D-mannosamine dehydrogenase [Puniceicoccales bacterium CK1056]|uniref:UDP-N-acetyl-D-mannosamine dehydrogenase n=1 Tax=Oceanipulchritudo coccoides TaxID=2706888 RepID=A0A6B2M264_9BACT|nr:UDP-N-acetyl-D-mannosamine dehydrogenase [Oceanipulchritudo coccoides]NDV63028.1 UDP-N-acetyl-D-mannosamine dehydrogenase [Oceanipulchritudo coccoides]